ncbi:hypothetical protein ACJX0J_036066 [Zea mays]
MSILLTHRVFIHIIMYLFFGLCFVSILLVLSIRFFLFSPLFVCDKKTITHVARVVDLVRDCQILHFWSEIYIYIYVLIFYKRYFHVNLVFNMPLGLAVMALWEMPLGLVIFNMGTMGMIIIFYKRYFHINLVVEALQVCGYVGLRYMQKIFNMGTMGNV